MTQIKEADGGHTPPESAVAQSAIKVLVVENSFSDFQSIAQLFTQLDQHHEFKLQYENNPYKAFRIINRGRHDLILINALLQSHTSLTLISDILETPPEAPIIVLSNHFDDELDHSFMQRGAVDCLCKEELTAPQLRRSIHHALERQRWQHWRSCERERFMHELEDLVTQRTQELQSQNQTLAQEIKKHQETQKQLIIYQKRLQQMAQDQFQVEKDERRRIAAELHDRIGQSLAFSKMKLEGLAVSLSHTSQKQLTHDILQEIKQAITDTRSLIFEINPPILDELGLEAAIEWLIEKMSASHHFQYQICYHSKPQPLASSIRDLLFQSIRELLSNVVKHAKAQQVTIDFNWSDDAFSAKVSDDGIGFRGQTSESPEGIPGFGLQHIKERINRVHGSLQIDSAPQRGSAVTLSVPRMPTEETSDD